MDVRVEIAEPLTSAEDLVVIGQLEGEATPYGLAGEPGGGEARGKAEKWALVHPRGSWAEGAEAGPKRVLVIGLGKREELDAERLRVAASIAAGQARRLRLGSIAWDLTAAGEVGPVDGAAALIDGTALADYRFDRFKSKQGDGEGSEVGDGEGSEAGDDEIGVAVTALTLLAAPGTGDDDLAELRRAAELERIAVTAQNRARDLQGTPGNHLTPTGLAELAARIAAAHPAVADESLGPDRIAEAEMGGMLAVSQGSAQDPHLVVLRYSGGGDGPTLGLVGKSVTFDTGGISLKPPPSMPDMKMDMSGGAAVLEAVAAIAEMGLEVNVLAVLPAVENMPSGKAIKPGDIITHYSGKTTEVNNTDAEGRLVLADALTYCIESGAERVVDIATLTGAVMIALGSTYSGLIANDDELAEAVADAGEAAGELAWRLPLHREYRALIRGKVADLSNASADRKAGTIYAGAYLEAFVGETPWAHLDIAGTAWDTDRAYFGKGPTGVGTRLLINLARAYAAK